MTSTYRYAMGFEAEVRRMAEALWNVPPGTCQPQRYIGSKEVGEVDGVLRLRDITHLLMATTQTKLQKIREDVSKLLAAKKLEIRDHPENQVALWMITEHQLDALVLKHARDSGVTALTLQDFARRFFDGSKYLLQRQTYYFGSATNPDDGSAQLSLQRHISPTIHLEQRSLRGAIQTSRNKNEDELVSRIRQGSTLVLLAPFGSGKSFNGYVVFDKLSRLFRQNEHPRTPVFLNLRDHWGQEYGELVLETHARKIGFAPADDLVRAWRAGLIDLLMDGFDELGSQVIARPDDKRFMRRARADSLKGVRELIQKSPAGIGLIVSGRDHYFDDLAELEHTLGLGLKLYSIARLDEFSEKQAADFIVRHGAHTSLPDWLPRKPLLLGYLARQGLLRDVLVIDGSEGFGKAWDTFIDLVCKREADLASSTMEAGTLRLVLETLSSKVRTLTSGTGPISELDLAEAYRRLSGQSAAGAVLAQLQRLPGMTERGLEAGLRSFVDEDFLSALQGSSMSRLVLNNAEDPHCRAWLNPLSPRGIEMAAYLLQRRNFTPESLVSKCSYTLNHGGAPQLVSDLLAVAVEIARDTDELDCRGLKIVGASIGTLDLDHLCVNNLELQDCSIEELNIGEKGASSSVKILGSLIVKVNGVASRQGIPAGLVADDCEIDSFEEMATNSAVVHSNFPTGMKALLTVLRKLYLQPGAGRRLSALERGLPGNVRDKVPTVLDELLRAGLITRFEKVVHPVRRQNSRVHSILSAPMVSEDPIAMKCRELK